LILQKIPLFSPFLRRYADKVQIIPPPVELPNTSPQEIKTFKNTNNPSGKRPVIGMATRFAAEKGVEILLDSFPQVLKEFPNAMVLYAGQYKDVWKEESYRDRLMPAIKKYQGRDQWRFVGNLSLKEIAAFYPNLDVLVVPSLNSTETFGLVQIEAMINGVPTVASDLPGVRQPPLMTGMGEVVPIGDSNALAEAIVKILDNPADYVGDPPSISKQFAPDTNAAAYESVYQDLLNQFRG